MTDHHIDTTAETHVPAGRFAPSPSGRMHLGNIFTALISWLSARKSGGKWILRIEDLDPQRSKTEYARQIEDDLDWLGLDWDEGGTENKGPAAPYMQSQRDDFYAEALERIRSLGITYPCRCTRADIMATQAPHESDGRIIYSGTCRPAERPPFPAADTNAVGAVRLYVPGDEITFTDGVFGRQCVALDRPCGDFVIRRADGAWAYQLAVVVDDALMGVTEVVRGCDLLLSAAQQLYIYSLLGYPAPAYYHLPLICNSRGQRLSKRDEAMSMAELRRRFTAEEIIGKLASIARITNDCGPCSAKSLIEIFDWSAIPRQHSVVIDQNIFEG